MNRSPLKCFSDGPSRVGPPVSIRAGSSGWLHETALMSRTGRCVSCGQGRHQGFTLIELMVVVAVIAILAAIAVPSYANYVKRSRAKSAGADLAALSLNFENYFQRKLAYPKLETTTTAATKTGMPGWAPSQGDFFVYTVTSDASADSSGIFYTLTATGSGSMNGCNLVLKNDNTRSIGGGSACGGLASW